jgi:copper(I)-binding protein
MQQPDGPPGRGPAPECRRRPRRVPARQLPECPRPAGRRPGAIRVAVAAAAIAVGAGALAGCAAQAAAAASIQAGNGYVVVPASGGTTEAFLVIRNNGSADRLTSVRTSAGGRVIFRVPVRPGAITMRTVSNISIPAHATVRFSPDSPHLLLTGTRPLHGGTQLTLTLAFAKGGTMSVVAVVTNPATGGSSYFIN